MFWSVHVLPAYIISVDSSPPPPPPSPILVCSDYDIAVSEALSVFPIFVSFACAVDQFSGQQASCRASSWPTEDLLRLRDKEHSGLSMVSERLWRKGCETRRFEAIRTKLWDSSNNVYIWGRPEARPWSLQNHQRWGGWQAVVGKVTVTPLQST